MPKQSMQPTDTGAHQDQFRTPGIDATSWGHASDTLGQDACTSCCPHMGWAATSSQPSAAQPTGWCGRGGRPSLQWGRAALPGVTSLSPSRRARRPSGPRPRTRSSLASRSTSDQWSASASPLRKPLLTSRCCRRRCDGGILESRVGVSQDAGRSEHCASGWPLAAALPGGKSRGKSMVYITGMNRIRHFFAETLPPAACTSCFPI